MLDVVGSAPRTLATLTPGESARIEAFQYGVVRGLCSDLGIREGSVVHCRAGTGGVIVLDTEHGQTVSLARDWARFIVLAPAA
jgi:hypothetical protein